MIVPCGVIRPTRGGDPDSVNHRLPSGPAVMPCGTAPEPSPDANSVIVPCGVIRPIAPAASVNQRLPSGPAAMSWGELPMVSPTQNSEIVPPGVIHGWADIPDHVDYLSFRPSHGVMKNGWVNPTIVSK